MPAGSPNYVPVIIVALVAWRMYRRIQRTVGRQPLRKKRMITGIVIYSVLAVVFALPGIKYPMILAGLGGGLVLGAPLALVSLRFTKFEATPEGRFYTSHPYIGLSIAGLLVIRMIYRMTTIMGNSPQTQANPAAMRSPLTFAIFGLLAGYYITFYAGVLIRGGKLQAPAQGALSSTETPQI